MRLLLCILILANVAACGRLGLDRLGGGGDTVAVFNGIRFDAKLTASDEDKRDVSITVTPVAVNPKAALEAGRYEATKYCLRNYGGSATNWTVGPNQPIAQLQVVDDTIALRGRCAKR